MDKIYDDLDAGLSALERLSKFSQLFPTFDINNDIENAYSKENDLEKSL